MNARYHDPQAQRFLSEDLAPPSYADRTNLYRYAGNNPITNIDPTGHGFGTGASIGKFISNPAQYIANAAISGLNNFGESSIGQSLLLDKAVNSGWGFGARVVDKIHIYGASGEWAKHSPAGIAAKGDATALHAIQKNAARAWTNTFAYGDAGYEGAAMSYLNNNTLVVRHAIQAGSFSSYNSNLTASVLPSGSDYQYLERRRSADYERDNPTPLWARLGVDVPLMAAYANPFGAITGPIVHSAGAAYTRHLDGQSVTRSIFGGIGDATGGTSIVRGIRNRDPLQVAGGFLQAGLTFAPAAPKAVSFAKTNAPIVMAAGRNVISNVSSTTGNTFNTVSRVRLNFEPVMGSGMNLNPQFHMAPVGARNSGFMTVEKFNALPAKGTVSPWSVRTSQNTASWNFKPPFHNTSIGEAAYQLRQGKLSPSQFGPVQIVEKDGMIWSVDNRRILAYRSAGMDIPYAKTSWDALTPAQQSHFTSTTNGGSIIILMPK